MAVPLLLWLCWALYVFYPEPLAYTWIRRHDGLATHTPTNSAPHLGNIRCLRIFIKYSLSVVSMWMSVPVAMVALKHHKHTPAPRTHTHTVIVYVDHLVCSASHGLFWWWLVSTLFALLAASVHMLAFVRTCPHCRWRCSVNTDDVVGLFLDHRYGYGEAFPFGCLNHFRRMPRHEYGSHGGSREAEMRMRMGKWARTHAHRKSGWMCW